MFKHLPVRGLGLLFARAFIVLVFTFTYAEPDAAILNNVKRSLHDKINAADWVYHVRILAIEHQQYTERSQRWTCGTNFVVQTVERLKGPEQRTFTFAGYLTPLDFEINEIRPGDEILVLLSSRPQHADPSDQPDVPLISPSAAKAECLSRLNPIRHAQGQEMAFRLVSWPIDKSHREVWMEYMRSDTEIPEGPGFEQRPYADDCGLPDCETSAMRRVRWAPIREAIVAWTRCDD